MRIQKLWYVKQGGNVSGPFPAKVIVEHRLLGRIEPDDLVSLDQSNWQPLDEVIGLTHFEDVDSSAMDYEEIKWNEERRKAALRWADERSVPDRRESAAGISLDERRSKGDRRLNRESAETLLLRQRHGELEFTRGDHFRSKRVFIVSATVALLLIAGYWFLSPVNSLKVDMGTQTVSCNQPHAKVNWSGCDKNGAWLENADLSSANLTGAHLNSAVLNHANLKYATLVNADLSYASLRFANLSGANLNHGNLSYADLQGADLHYADMRNANLSEAKLKDANLDNAIWTDGRTCATGSRGACR
jgi:hypothetical protein